MAEIDYEEMRETVRNELRESGVELQKPEIATAVDKTIAIFEARLRQASVVLEEVERDSREAAAYARAILEEQLAETKLRKERPWNIAIIIFGIIAIGVVIFNSVTMFHEWHRTHGSIGDLFGFVAYAQSAEGTATHANIREIGTLIVYLLLGIGYLVNLGGLFFGKQPKDRAHAMEITKLLTSFFVGAITGQVR